MELSLVEMPLLSSHTDSGVPALVPGLSEPCWVLLPKKDGEDLVEMSLKC